MRHIVVLVLLLTLPGCRKSSLRPYASADPSSPGGTSSAEELQSSEGIRSCLVAWTKGDAERTCECVTALPVPGRPDVWCANIEWETGWSGTFKVCGIEGGAVAWEAFRPDLNAGGAFILSARPLKLRGFANPVIEVFDSSHMGNGDICLYELKDRTLIPLLRTRAVTHLGQYSLKEEHLSAEYRDMNLDGVDDLDLTGTGRDEGDDICDPDPETKAGIIGKGPSSEFPCRKLYFWDADSHCFVENRNYRQGLDVVLDE